MAIPGLLAGDFLVADSGANQACAMITARDGAG
jgi:hypothetical protein